MTNVSVEKAMTIGALRRIWEQEAKKEVDGTRDSRLRYKKGSGGRKGEEGGGGERLNLKGENNRPPQKGLNSKETGETTSCENASQRYGKKKRIKNRLAITVRGAEPVSAMRRNFNKPAKLTNQTNAACRKRRQSMTIGWFDVKVGVSVPRRRRNEGDGSKDIWEKEKVGCLKPRS